MSSLDSSILNQITIKQLVEAVIETHNGSVERTAPDRWQVDLPPELANYAGDGAGSRNKNTGNSALDSIANDIYGSDEPENEFENTLVFDSRHEETGEDDIFVRPGTTFFNALLELAQDQTTVSSIRLAPDTLQIHKPPLVESLGADARVGTFERETTDMAVAFHFHIQFEGTQSYHQEEFETVTLDGQTGENLPTLTERLLAHLGDLSHDGVPAEFDEIDDGTTERLYTSAIDIIKERLEPELNELRAEAAKAAAERESEIRDLYEQRRQELDEQIQNKQERIYELNQKAKNARNNNTRQRYTEQQKEVRDELEELKTTVDTQKEQLKKEEEEQIANTTARHAVEADVTHVGTTIITYDRGTLPVQIRDDGRVGETTVTYTPATNEFGTFDCADCGTTLGTDQPPVVCEAGHVICSDCRQQCEQCGLIGCGHEGLTSCPYCGTVECATCNEACTTCARPICDAHRTYRSADGGALCEICGDKCATCGDVFDGEGLTDCDVTVDGYCLDHFGDCNCSNRQPAEKCGLHCSEHIGTCIDCGSATCDEHLEPCLVCDGGVCVTDRVETVNAEQVCSDHAGYCRQCDAYHIVNDLLVCAVDDYPICEEHSSRCHIGGEVVCEEHQVTCATCAEVVCTNHAELCDHCDQHHCETHSTTCATCEKHVGTAHVESCTECGDTICPADRSTCATCDDIFCTPHSVSCTECGDRFCYDHAEECTTCSEWTCEIHLSSCTICDEQSCPSHTDHCVECGMTLCVDHQNKCRDCDTTYCPDDVIACSVCDRPVCSSHVSECGHCGDILCSEDLVECSVCDRPRCPEHTMDCADCGDVFCSDHILDCAGCDNVVCEADAATCDTCGEVFEESHTDACGSCGELFCAPHREECTTCGESLCEEHAHECGADGKLHCNHHLETCAVCIADTEDEPTPYCEDHRISCVVGGENLCREHVQQAPILAEPICQEHTEQCALCQQDYAPAALTDGRCETCDSISSDELSVPESVAEEFRSIRAAENEEYLIIYGKRLLSSNQLVVIERETKTEIDRRKIGLIMRLKGVFR